MLRYNTRKPPFSLENLTSQRKLAYFATGEAFTWRNAKRENTVKNSIQTFRHLRRRKILKLINTTMNIKRIEQQNQKPGELCNKRVKRNWQSNTWAPNGDTRKEYLQGQEEMSSVYKHRRTKYSKRKLTNEDKVSNRKRENNRIFKCSN